MPAHAPLFPARIGLGTWKMGEANSARTREIAAVTHALEVGYRLLDTAEMYGHGNAERIVGAALQSFGVGRRAELCIVSKVLPGNASQSGTVRACEASLRRLGCEYLDVYLLHWHGSESFEDTLRGFAELLRRGLIRNYGVSNLDLEELEQWREAERTLGMDTSLRCNQLFYCLQARTIEFDVLPWQRAHGIETMAYSPLGRGELVRHPLLLQIAREHGVSAAEVALAWCIRDSDVVAIPKSVHPQRIDENLRASQLQLSTSDLRRLDQAFPPPHSKRPLPMI
jgi:diketogulonate reductase-like aldo/keto reductase